MTCPFNSPTINIMKAKLIRKATEPKIVLPAAGAEVIVKKIVAGQGGVGVDVLTRHFVVTKQNKVTFDAVDRQGNTYRIDPRHTEYTVKNEPVI